MCSSTRPFLPRRSSKSASSCRPKYAHTIHTLTRWLAGSLARENSRPLACAQYERWQPRARYKQSLDPTVDDVKKLCVSLRRNAKDERVLFHYNGHGVPRPTNNGEIWVFNKVPLFDISLSL